MRVTFTMVRSIDIHAFVWTRIYIYRPNTHAQRHTHTHTHSHIHIHVSILYTGYSFLKI